MEEGWIKVHRKLMHHWIWKNNKYLKAWMYCLFKANHTGGKVLIGTELVEIKRGEFITSINKFSKSTNLSEKETRTFFKRLEEGTMVVRKRAHKWSQITICNYDSYQTQGQAEGITKGKQRATNKNEKNEKKKKTPLPPVEKNEELVLPDNLNSPKFRAVWNEEWIPYRRERNIAPYKPRGLKAALSGLDRDSNGDVRTAIQIIRYSIEKNWQGLFPLKGDAKPYKRKHGTLSGTDFDTNVTEIQIKK